MQGNELRKGTCVTLEGKVWQCMEAHHRTPGNLRAFIQAKMRNLKDGSQKEFRFSSTERLEQIDVFERKMQYLYSDAEMLHFMDTENYEQVEFAKASVGLAANYLTENLVLSVLFVDNVPINIQLPATLAFEVVEADPEIKGATAAASYKSARVSNGLAVQVPQFVKVGDFIKINTETGEYLERVKR